MLIDWFTVAAQLINFLVLVWLLKRFLYQPILQALNQREQKIATELAQADAQKQLAEQQYQQFVLKNQAFEQEKAALLAQALAEVNREQQVLLEAVKQEAQTLRAKWQQSLALEYQAINQEIALKTQTEVFAIVAKTLTDLANVSLEMQMVDVFVQRLERLAQSEREQWLTTLSLSTEPLRVRTAFALPDAQKNQLETCLNSVFAVDKAIEFEVVPQLVSGIEVFGNGQKLAWSIADYLAELQSHLSEILSPLAFAAHPTEAGNLGA